MRLIAITRDTAGHPPVLKCNTGGLLQTYPMLAIIIVDVADSHQIDRVLGRAISVHDEPALSPPHPSRRQNIASTH